MVTKLRFSRRTALVTAAASTALSVALPSSRGFAQTDAANELRALEATSGGRLGVCFLDTGTGAITGHRMHERFAMCSSFKVLLAALVLREAERGAIDLEQRLPFTEVDGVNYPPALPEDLKDETARIIDLTRAVQVTSDNVATNLLLKLLGGPEAFTRKLRDLGDNTTRLDRYELDLNVVPTGEIRDTTTPHAKAHTLRRFLTGNILSPASRDQLVSWMEATQTGAKRIRAGLPHQWRAGDKTGTFMLSPNPNKYNDVAIVWPPERAPLIVTSYFEAESYFDHIRDQDQKVLADVGRVLVQWSQAET